MVVALLVAVVLDNTVPGSRQEREVYVWSEPKAAQREPVAKDHSEWEKCERNGSKEFYMGSKEFYMGSKE
ncbi:hypothetical protein L6452_19020 [Arctium lappa]|uniref:Uncharacterized protein n=1 Tax=Arctium lappa TaxID=4217 RepID=A0ACB9B8S8_ARCLA|nr:hypothetical protein L6452_19020 [Arctium lappa]